ERSSFRQFALEERHSRGAALGLVGLDDALDKRMAHDILCIEEGECDTLHSTQYVDHVAQPGLLAVWKIRLRHIAGHDCLGAETNAGKKHLHLLDGGVLRLIEDDERVIERAASHESQRRDLDHVALYEARYPVEPHHLVKRVVHRA